MSPGNRVKNVSNCDTVYDTTPKLTKSVRHTSGADYEFYRDSTGRVRLILIYPSAERMRQALDDDSAACPQCGLSGYCLCSDGLGPND